MSNRKNQYIFNSINELITELDNSEVIKGRDKSSNSRGDGDEWSDVKSYDEARENMLNGKMHEALEGEIEKYRTKGTVNKRVAKMGVAGYQVVVPLYLQGIPNNMVTSKKVINNKIITIFYACQAPHYVDRKQIEKTTSELMKNIISLESDGYRVNLYVIEVNSDDNGKWGYALKLKTDRETLNIKKICYPLVSSSFLRRIGFRIKERLYKDWIGGGYGTGTFNYEVVDKFIRQQFKISNYEIWNYQGKQEKR